MPSGEMVNGIRRTPTPNFGGNACLRMGGSQKKIGRLTAQEDSCKLTPSQPYVWHSHLVFNCKRPAGPEGLLGGFSPCNQIIITQKKKTVERPSQSPKI